MDKLTMQKLIDHESGEGFHKNIDLSGYNFYKNNSFISFKIIKIDGMPVANINYIYSDNKNDFCNLMAYCFNFWVGSGIKFVYYKEKVKNKPYTKKTFEVFDFTIDDEGLKPGSWVYDFDCVNGEKPCVCKILEAFT